VVRGVPLGGLFRIHGTEFPMDFCLGWSPGGMDQRGRGGLTDMGEDLVDGLGISQECDEGEGRLAGGTD
ncbi:hypothetical protein ACFL5A_05225, partial [Gemmatimonadota bacterium]